MTSISMKADCFTLLNGDILTLRVKRDVRPRTIIGLLGGNGTGKTTFLNSLLHAASDIKSSDTTFQFDTQPVISYVPQDPSDLLTPWLKVKKVFEIFSSNINSLVLEEGDYMLNKKVKKLSGGQKQIVANHMALNRNHDLLLLDEPTSSMDEERKRRWMKALRAHVNAQDVICFISLHDMLAMHYLCDQIYLFNRANKSIVAVDNESKISWEDYVHHQVNVGFAEKLIKRLA